MSDRTKYWVKFTVRWGIAVFGIWWVLSNISFRDRVLLVHPVTHELEDYQVLGDARDEDAQFRIVEDAPSGPVTRVVDRSQLWVRPDRSTVTVLPQDDGGPRKWKVIAVRPAEAAAGAGKELAVVEILARHPDTKQPQVLPASRVAKAEDLTVSSPRVEVGLIRLFRDADKAYLIGAIFLLPLNYLLTSLRWNVLLRAVDIRLTQARTFVLNMVGAFYNAFMPGTTGGDLVKAYYAAKQTTHRTRAVMTVIVDRGIGLLALVIIGGAMAAYQWDIPDCRRVAALSALMVGMTVLGAIVFYVPFLRRVTGLNFILRRLPMQRQVHKAVEALELYGKRPGMTLGALGMAFPVHFASILSATLAGRAFGLTLDDLYYWAVVPVITLVGAIPISPQGAGVMEYFAVELTKRHGVTVAQAFALTMSIRLIAMLWNLAGGLFVLRGGFHAPTEQEQHELEVDEGEPAGEPVPAGTAANRETPVQPPLPTGRAALPQT